MTRQPAFPLILSRRTGMRRLGHARPWRISVDSLARGLPAGCAAPCRGQRLDSPADGVRGTGHAASVAGAAGMGAAHRLRCRVVARCRQAGLHAHGARWWHHCKRTLAARGDPDPANPLAAEHAVRAARAGGRPGDALSYHQTPFYLLSNVDSLRKTVTVSQTARCDLLALVAEADARGRVTADQSRLLENVALFAEYCREHGCYDRPRPFASDHARFLYFRDLNAAIPTAPPTTIAARKWWCCPASPGWARITGSPTICWTGP